MFYAAKLINDYQTAKNFYVKFISVCINKLPSPSGGAGGGPQGWGFKSPQPFRWWLPSA